MRHRPLTIAREVILWILALFLAYVFIRQGIAKFDSTSGWARAFRVWHYPDWFRVLVGVVEVGAVVLLLTRRLASVGAVMIMVVMLGAMATHLWWGQPRYMTSEVLPLTLSTIIAVMRWRLLPLNVGRASARPLTPQ